MEEAVSMSGRKLHIHRRTLNSGNFSNILLENPRVLFINCHGQIKKRGDKNEASFWFEDMQNPFVVDKFDEDRLERLVNGLDLQIEVIVLSTCHSEKLGEILLKCSKKNAPIVIAVNSKDALLELAAHNFNRQLILSLAKDNCEIKEAFT